MSTRRSIVVASLLATMLVVPAAVAPTIADAGPGKGGGLQRRLGLSDEQMSALRQIRERDTEGRRELGRQLAEAQTALRQLALNGGEQAAIDAKAAEVQGLLARAVQMRVKQLQEMAPILTPEQREKLAQMPFDHWSRSREGRRPAR
jgi:Spy/CpxP family protein refolding chaperone